MLETLENLSSRLRMPPLIPAEVEKIRECISENKNSTMELEKLQPSFGALKRRGEELIGRSQGTDKDVAAKGEVPRMQQRSTLSHLSLLQLMWMEQVCVVCVFWCQ